MTMSFVYNSTGIPRACHIYQIRDKYKNNAVFFSQQESWRRVGRRRAVLSPPVGCCRATARGAARPLSTVAARVEIILHVLDVGDLAGERFGMTHFKFGIDRTAQIHHAIDGLNVQLRGRTEFRMLAEKLAHLGIDRLIGSAILRRTFRKYGAAIETRAKNEQKADCCNGFDFLHSKYPLLNDWVYPVMLGQLLDIRSRTGVPAYAD